MNERDLEAVLEEVRNIRSKWRQSTSRRTRNTWTSSIRPRRCWMMKNRDLKADLELFNKATPGPWEFGAIYAGTIAGELDEERDRANRELLGSFREGWPHAIERALEAEALARELVDALRGVSGMLDYATRRCRCGVCEYCNAQKRADKALAKAKEVLGDD